MICFSFIKSLMHRGFSRPSILTLVTKIYEFVCPPNISETVAVKILKLAHRPCIASTTIAFNSKAIVLSILSILLKTIRRIGVGPSANRRRHLMFTVIRPTPFISVSWIICCCHLADKFYYIIFSILIRIVLMYSYGELNCDRLHILLILIYIITPLLTL